MELKEAKHILEERKSLLINSSMPDISLVTAIDTALNELDKLQKENKNLKAENRILSVKLAEYFSDNNLCEKGCKYCESEKDKE